MKVDRQSNIQYLGRKKLVPQKSDSALVNGALAGDADSFTQLCRRYYPAMVAIAHSIIGDRHLAEDAAQQAFADAVRKLPQLRKKEKFAAWLTVICRNAAFDLARKTDVARASNDLSSVAAEPHTDDMVQAIKDAVTGLSVSEREIIFLRFYDGMSYGEISAVLGISNQAINGRLRRAKKKIAMLLTRNGFEEVSL